MMDIVKYFEEEEKTLKQSKAFLAGNENGSKYEKLFSLIISLNFATIQDLNNADEDIKTVSYTGARLFNSAIISYKQALSGYYQHSFLTQRDILETQFLLNDFKINPENIKKWRDATNKERKEVFSTFAIYTRLDNVDGYKSKRQEIYQRLCEYAAHISYPGFKLLTDSEQHIMIGPFFDDKKLLNTLHDLNKYYGLAVLFLSLNIKSENKIATRFLFGFMELYKEIFNIEMGNEKAFTEDLKTARKTLEELDK